MTVDAGTASAPLAAPRGDEFAAAQLGARALARVVFDEATIRRRVVEMGREIGGAYDAGADVLVLGLLKGSFVFFADLVREIPLPVQVDFVAASSYGDGRVGGEVELLYNPRAPIEGRHVILVEDIVDSGATIDRLVPILLARRPASLEVCTLLHKRLARPERDARWVGFDAPEEFLVGYGLDFAEDFRHLPYIGSI